MTDTKLTFQPVRYGITKTIACQSCGRKRNRSTTFMQTLNPFNKNAAGRPKTYDEIWEELSAEAKAWEPAPLVTCSKCPGRTGEGDEL